MRIIEQKEALEVLTSPACIPVMREALINIETDVASLYLRTAIPMRPGKIFAFMPSYYNDKYYGAKVISVFPGNTGTEYPSHIGQVLLCDSENGAMLAMVDGTAITKVRTGAVSAVATDALARKDAHSLGLLGAGTQARSHYAAIKCVRDIDTVYIYDIERKYAEALAAELKIEASRASNDRFEVIVCETASEAAKNADIICTLTHSSEPLIDVADVKPGTHINAVGACAAKDRELGTELVASSKFYGDNKEAVFAESGDMLYPVSEGRITADHYLGNIAAVLLGNIEGRTSDDEITVFEALGLATEDVAAAIYCYEQLSGIDTASEQKAPAKPDNTEKVNALKAEIAQKRSILNETEEYLALAVNTHNQVMDDLKSISREITDMNIENGLLQNKIFGQKKAKEKFNANLVLLEDMNAKMETLKEDKEMAEIDQRRHQKNVDKLQKEVDALLTELEKLK